MILQTTLCLAAAAAVINIWISIRVGQMRHATKVTVGDGGNEMLVRRMRAHANFIENTPLALILIAAIELATAGTGGAAWLSVVGAIYMVGRVCHALGMDGGRLQPLRGIGVLVTMLTLLGLAVVAVLIALGRF